MPSELMVTKRRREINKILCPKFAEPSKNLCKTDKYCFFKFNLFISSSTIVNDPCSVVEMAIGVIDESFFTAIISFCS